MRFSSTSTARLEADSPVMKHESVRPTYRSVSAQPLSIRQQLTGQYGFGSAETSRPSTHRFTSHRGARGVGIEAACRAPNSRTTRVPSAHPLRIMDAPVAPTRAPQGRLPGKPRTARRFRFPSRTNRQVGRWLVGGRCPQQHLHAPRALPWPGHQVPRLANKPHRFFTLATFASNP
jgi:hypothetical protein